MLKRFAPRVNSHKALADLQLDRLSWTLNHAYSHSDFYRRHFTAAGVSPQDFSTLADLRRFPVTTAEDFRDGYPLPFQAVANRDIVRIHASSGTTGKRKVVAYTQKDIDDWLNMFCRCYEMAGLTREDRVQICVGYGVWTAGVGFQLACERFGAMALPTGPGNLDLQCTFLVDFSTTILCCTSSMALLLAEEVQRRGLRDQISLRKVICGSERTSAAMRRRIVDLLGLEEFYDIPGLTEVYGPGTGLTAIAAAIFTIGPTTTFSNFSIPKLWSRWQKATLVKWSIPLSTKRRPLWCAIAPATWPGRFPDLVPAVR